MRKTAKKSSGLEREVIFAVIVLYLLLSAALLAIHFFQPESRITETSSASPSHIQKNSKDPNDKK